MIAGNRVFCWSMEVLLRISVIDPPPGVVFRLRRGRSELVSPSTTTAKSISFDFQLCVQVGAAGEPVRLLGPFAQGPPASRFVYVNAGKQAGQTDSCWDRRAKVPLADLSAALIENAFGSRGSIIEAQIAGTGRDGGPACATVPLLRPWRIVTP